MGVRGRGSLPTKGRLTLLFLNGRLHRLPAYVSRAQFRSVVAPCRDCVGEWRGGGYSTEPAVHERASKNEHKRGTASFCCDSSGPLHHPPPSLPPAPYSDSFYDAQRSSMAPFPGPQISGQRKEDRLPPVRRQRCYDPGCSSRAPPPPSVLSAGQ